MFRFFRRPSVEELERREMFTSVVHVPIGERAALRASLPSIVADVFDTSHFLVRDASDAVEGRASVTQDVPRMASARLPE